MNTDEHGYHPSSAEISRPFPSGRPKWESVFIGVHLWLFCLLATALAEDVGTVASMRGDAQIGRAGAFAPATVGVTVQLGDELRTGGDGQLRVVFRDDSVIDLAESSSLVVDQQVFDPDAGRFSSLVKLLQGKARSLVGSYYGTPGASYEVQTPTAVAGVRGTTFLVAYDPVQASTQVIGIHGTVAVHGLAAAAAETVYVNAQEATFVLEGEGPTPPQPVDERFINYETERLDVMSLVGIGTAAGVQALSAGSTVPAPDRAPSAAGLVGQLGRDELRNAGDVTGQPLGVVEATRGRLGIPF